jgi:hypothetical protein
VSREWSMCARSKVSATSSRGVVQVGWSTRSAATITAWMASMSSTVAVRHDATSGCRGSSGRGRTRRRRNSSMRPLSDNSLTHATVAGTRGRARRAGREREGPHP